MLFVKQEITKTQMGNTIKPHNTKVYSGCVVVLTQRLPWGQCKQNIVMRRTDVRALNSAHPKCSSMLKPYARNPHQRSHKVCLGL